VTWIGRKFKFHLSKTEYFDFVINRKQHNTERMTQLNLVDSFKEFKEFKNIDHDVMMGILEDVFRAMILKKYGDDSNFDIIINPDKGDLEICGIELLWLMTPWKMKTKKSPFLKPWALKMILRWERRYQKK
jgi:hypothetical protein